MEGEGDVQSPPNMRSSSIWSKHEQTKPRDQHKNDKSISRAFDNYMACDESSLLFSMEKRVTKMILQDDFRGQTKPRGQPKKDKSSSHPLDSYMVQHKSPRLSSMESISGVFGRKDDEKRITKMILSDDCKGRHVSFLRVIGDSGLGKTTLISRIYHEKWVSRYFETKGWVFLSAERCDRMGLLLRAIVECFTDVSCGGLTDLDELREILEEELMGKRFLLVLDNACNKDPNFWSDLLRILSTGAKGSVVVVTAQTESVANFEGLKHSYQLNLLEDDICWRIIMSKILYRREFSDISPNLEGIGKMITASCKGVPLFAKVISEIICRNKVYVLQSGLWDGSKQESTSPPLRMVYNQLPTGLQQCFMYCSLFPKGYIFEEDYLIQLWISQGFIGPGKRREEDTARKYFRDLSDMSFFEHAPLHDTIEGIGKFVMHELLCDLAQSVAGDAFFRTEYYELSYGISKDVRHLSFAPTVYDPLVQLEPFKELTGLNSLLVINSSPFRSVNSLFYVDNLASLDDLLSKSRCLRTLDLSHTNIKELPDSIAYLESLQFLGLNNTNIRKLPDPIGRLSNLQTLELRDCYCLCELPDGIKNLVNLRHLDVWKETGVICTPLGIGKLTKLQTLGTFNVGELCKISELRNLNSIRGHLRIGCLENVIQGIDAVLAFMEKKYLRKLTLQWNSRGEELEDNERVVTAGEVLENLRPNKDLQELIIRDYGGLKFPTWLAPSFLRMLDSVTLVNCYACDGFPILGQLRFLRHLFMQNVNGVRHVVSDLGGESTTVSKRFPSLDSLKLWEMYELEDWYDVKEMDFPYLRSVSISRCPRMRSLPSFTFLVDLSVHCCGQFPFPDLRYLRTMKFDGLQTLTSLALPSTLGSLETLEIHYCKKLSSLDGLQYQKGLKKLKLRNCPELSFPQDVKLPDALQVIDIHCSCTSLKNWCPDDFKDISFAHDLVSRRLVRQKLRGET